MPPSAKIKHKVDLHMHTVEDPMDLHVWHTAEELIDKAASRGFTVLAITLHGVQFESERIRDYAAQRGILLIPGVEQNVEGAHVLLLNFEKETADAVRTFSDLKAAKQSQGEEAMVVAAHPFYPNAVALREKLFAHHEVFDGVEISGYYHRFWNPNHKARSAAEQLNLPVIGNSDTHTLEQFGTIWTELEAEANAASVLTALKRGEGRVHERPLTWDEMACITYKVVGRGYMPWINYKRTRGYR